MGLPNLSEVESTSFRPPGKESTSNKALLSNSSSKEESEENRPKHKRNRGRPTIKEREKKLKKRNKNLPDDLVGKDKSQLVDIFFNENEELDLNIEKIIKNDLKMGKNQSSLSGVRKTLEDILNVQQLTDLVQTFRENKKKGSGSGDTSIPQDQVNGVRGGNDMSSLLPLLMQQNGGSGGLGDLDPLLLMTMMQGNNNGNPANNLLSLLTITQTLADKNKSSGDTADIIRTIYEEFKNTQNQSRGTKIDPNTILMFKLLGNNNSSNNEGGKIELLLSKMNEIMSNNNTQKMEQIIENSNRKFEEIARMIAGAMRKDPKDDLIDMMDLFNKIQGQSRKMDKEEMKYDLEKRKLEMEENRKQNMLRAQQQAKQMEAEKSQKVIDSVKEMVGPILQQGIGKVVSGAMNASNQMKATRHRREKEISVDDVL